MLPAETGTCLSPGETTRPCQHHIHQKIAGTLHHFYQAHSCWHSPGLRRWLHSGLGRAQHRTFSAHSTAPASRWMQHMQNTCSSQPIPFRPLSLLFHKPCPIPLAPVSRENLLPSSCHLDSFSSVSPAHHVSIYKCQLKNKIYKITYSVSFIFTYCIYDCLFCSPSCYWFCKHLLQHFLHTIYVAGGSCSVPEPWSSQPSLANLHRLMIRTAQQQLCQDTFCKIKCY